MKPSNSFVLSASLRHKKSTIFYQLSRCLSIPPWKVFTAWSQYLFWDFSWSLGFSEVSDPVFKPSSIHTRLNGLSNWYCNANLICSRIPWARPTRFREVWGLSKDSRELSKVRNHWSPKSKCVNFISSQLSFELFGRRTLAHSQYDGNPDIFLFNKFWLSSTFWISLSWTSLVVYPFGL